MKTQKLIITAVLVITSVVSMASNPVVSNKYDEPATFGTEQTDLSEYLKEELDYPKSLVDEGYEVKVVVKFWVDKFGNVLNAELMSAEETTSKEMAKGHLELFEEEAVETVKNMPKWNPATVNGTAAPVQYKLPILFTVK